ncbi:uncharacterized protein LOC120836994 [Ixodes scapularis]|uniref:uncharacterized protein LOC120836994 n=1 Tax=Ixodes scapularis TaxID=6945 RepID=UPI001C391F59|nr:uncharacterized protein LOC120836994 [Ixodes scapularis]
MPFMLDELPHLPLRSGRSTVTTMNDDNGNVRDQRPTNTSTVKTRQRDPQDFTGSADADVLDWLKNYDRVSQHNRWDDTIKLANVVFFLKGTALQWYDNHKEGINSWDAFKTAFADVFGTPERRRQQARDKLSRRYQAPSETSTSYIEDVLRLCGRVNAAMPEDEKIKHLFKGLSQELFSIVAPRSPQTVQQLIAECKHYEDLQSGRISNTGFERLPEVSITTADTDLPNLIRRIIRDELRDFLGSLRLSASSSISQPEAPKIEQVIKDELRAALRPISSSSPTCMAPSTSSPPICSLQHSAPHICALQTSHNVSIPSTRYLSPRRTEEWRTQDQRPICFYCHAPGHIIRYCRRRMNAEAYSRIPQNQTRHSDDHDTRRNFDNHGSSSDRRNFDDHRNTRPFPAAEFRRGRSPSPYPRRNRSVSTFTNATTGLPSSN